jgi:hypothetical protein
MTGGIGVGVFLFGVLSLFIGIALLTAKTKGEGAIETKWGSFGGPVWFIFMIFGIVIMIVGYMIPI